MKTARNVLCLILTYLCASQCQQTKQENNHIFLPDLHCNETTTARSISKDEFHYYKLYCDTPDFSSEIFNVIVSIISLEGDCDIFISNSNFFPITSKSYNWSTYSPLPIDGVSIQLPRKTHKHILYLTVQGFRDSIYMIEVLTSLKLIPFCKKPISL